jgi:hypothetical protein
MILNLVPDEGLFLADLLQGEFSTFIVDLFETVKAISGIAYYLAGL